MVGNLEVTFKDAALGVRQTIRSGSGKSVNVNIPAGVETGARLRVPGQGAPAPKSGQPGISTWTSWYNQMSICAAMTTMSSWRCR